MMRRWENFTYANRLKLANHWLQILLVLTLLIGLNYLAMRHFKRFDLTENHRFALSPETRAYLNEIREPVEVIVTIPANSPRQEEQVLHRYVEQLLGEYAYHSRRSGEFMITVEFIDIYKDLERADALARESGLDQVNSLLVRSGDRSKTVRAVDLVDFEERQPVAFKGEAALTSAIIEVTQETSPKLYFLTGHRETAPDDPSPRNGLSMITRELELRNHSIELLDLTNAAGVPEDAAILVLADPQGELLPSEVDKIRTYLFDRAGRVIAWFRPGVETGLGALLGEWGLHLPDQRVMETDPAYREAAGTLLIRNFGDHSITESLIRNQTVLVCGLARPVIAKPPVPADERLHYIPLFASSKSSWAESSYESPVNPVYDPGVDLRGPVPIAIATERRAATQLGIKVPGGRLAVFGTPDLFSNSRVSSLGNVTLFFNTINWMLDRDSLLVIPPRPVDTYQFALSESQLRRIGLLFLIVPGTVVLCGFLVYWIRHS